MPSLNNIISVEMRIYAQQDVIKVCPADLYDVRKNTWAALNISGLIPAITADCVGLYSIRRRRLTSPRD